MVITELAKTKIKQELQDKKANFLQLALAGNASSGYQTTITYETELPKFYTTITTNPLVISDPQAYSQFANSLFDFDPESNEIRLTF